jgi:hypothetical protein
LRHFARFHYLQADIFGIVYFDMNQIKLKTVVFISILFYCLQTPLVGFCQGLTVPQQLASYRSRLENEQAFVARIQQRINEAEAALAQARTQHDKDRDAAEIYAEAAKNIAYFGAQLSNNVPPTGSGVDDVMTFWTTVTASVSLERFKKAMDHLESAEQFELDWASGKYQQAIESLKTKLATYTSTNVVPLQARMNQFTIHFNMYVGTWRMATSVRQLNGSTRTWTPGTIAIYPQGTGVLIDPLGHNPPYNLVLYLGTGQLVLRSPRFWQDPFAKCWFGGPNLLYVQSGNELRMGTR